ncbi:MAG: hypothetical protein LBK73_01215 [Treponema sp.]|nr:hypothetical protein [Treponema sp.]
MFVINKADSYDSEKESLKETIRDVLDKLKRHGFDNPMVVPVSSRGQTIQESVAWTKLFY